MKALAITDKGIEDIAAIEIKELINSKAEIRDTCVVFSIKKLEDLCLLAYKSQSTSRILLLLVFFKFNDLLKNANENIENIGFSEWLDKDTKFVVRCIKVNNENLSTNEIEKKFGEFVINNVKKNKKYEQKVDLENPDVTFLVYVKDDECYFGVDFSGFDLSKRNYKIFMHPTSLKGTIAYALVRFSQYDKKDFLIDPFTGSGMIPIEAALYASNFSINYYNKEKFSFLKLKPFNKFDFDKFLKDIDKKIRKEKLTITGYDNSMKFVVFSRKNAKIAGIDKQINFTKVDAEWLDIKLKKNSVDKIVTDLPILSKYSDKKAVEKAYKELFYQAEYILKKDGIIVVLTRNLDSIKKFYEEFKFKLAEQRKIYSGKQELFIAKLKR